MSARRIIAGGLSSLHDTLVTAALRGAGVRAVALGSPDRLALATGRTLLSRGHPNSVYYLAGALIAHFRRSPCQPGDAVLVPVGHFSHTAEEYRRALAAAGIGEAEVIGLPIGDAKGSAAPWARVALALREAGLEPRKAALRIVSALAVADTLVALGCRHRPFATDAAMVDVSLASASYAIAERLERRKAFLPVLRELSVTLRQMVEDPPADVPPRPRVRIVGEAFPALTDGDGGERLVRRVEAMGAVVDPGTIGERILLLAWQARERDPVGARRIERLLRARYSRMFAEVNLLDRGPDGGLPDIEELALAAEPFYPSHLRGGSGPLEVATFLAVDRARSADLVVSIKPFGSITSSAVSDAVINVLAQRSAHTAFLAIETNGDQDAQIESRLLLAVEAAAQVAALRGRYV
jgi:predicted nucleotide-binding protein (sugar kinase/HSP70/actin superfamily)